jgi:hypothetical protein
MTGKLGHSDKNEQIALPPAQRESVTIRCSNINVGWVALEHIADRDRHLADALVRIPFCIKSLSGPR